MRFPLSSESGAVVLVGARMNNPHKGLPPPVVQRHILAISQSTALSKRSHSSKNSGVYPSDHCEQDRSLKFTFQCLRYCISPPVSGADFEGFEFVPTPADGFPFGVSFSLHDRTPLGPHHPNWRWWAYRRSCDFASVFTPWWSWRKAAPTYNPALSHPHHHDMGVPDLGLGVDEKRGSLHTPGALHWPR